MIRKVWCWSNRSKYRGFVYWLTWSSTDEHWLFGLCGAGVQRSHHMVDLRVHIQLDNVIISDHCDQQRQNEKTENEEMMVPIISTIAFTTVTVH